MPEQQGPSRPAQVEIARKKLLAHWRQIAPGERDTRDDTFRARYARVFESNDVVAMADLVIRAHEIGLRLDVVLIEPFLNGRSRLDAAARLEAVGRWLKRVNAQNHDGVILTPPLVEHLAGPRDIEDLIAELEHLRHQTRQGRFLIDNALQRDLELMRYSTEVQWVRGGPGGVVEDYAAFKELTMLPAPNEQPYTLADKHLPQLKRVAYEAVGFLRFLRTFAAAASRPIVVVGNDRYGRQWVVESLEEHMIGNLIPRGPASSPWGG